MCQPSLFMPQVFLFRCEFLLEVTEFSPGTRDSVTGLLTSAQLVQIVKGVFPSVVA